MESLRLLKVARDTAVKARTATMIALKATLVTAADELRAELEALTDHKLIQACAALDSEETVAAPEAAMRHVLGSLARRWLQLHAEIALHSQHLKTLTTAAAPRLLELVGVGFDIAAGSGRTNGRHRLYRGGNRQANAALYRAVIVRMRWRQPTIDYVTRRTAEGLSKREIIRCLKRYLAREIYRRLPPLNSNPAPATDVESTDLRAA